MPFIDIRTTKKLTDAQKEAVKSRFGEAMALIGKPEAYTMVGIIDGYTLYFAGNKLEDGAHIAVDILGTSNPANSEAFTRKACDIMKEQLGIPGQNVYVEYMHTTDWGWNGSNF